MTNSTATAAHADRVRDAVEGATRLLDGLAGEIAGLSDRELVEVTRCVEALGRRADLLRTRAAGEIDERSSRDAREDRLSAQFGCRNATEVLERATHADPRGLAARVRLDRRTRERASLTGEPLPAQFPAVASAYAACRIGEDAATYITDALARVNRRGTCSPADIAVAEREIVAAATGDVDAANGEHPAETFSDVRLVTDTWASYLERNGQEPVDEPERFRSLSIGRARDGLVPLHGDLTPEAAAQLQRLLDAHRTSTVRFASDDDADTDPSTPLHDPRTAPQRRHDHFLSILHGAAASASAPTIGGAAPTLVVTVDVHDLEGGTCRADGIDVPIPAALARRTACSGAVQKVVFDERGRIVQLGSRERLFSAHQRRAIAARDGGCIIPGCTIPAAWCEIHHVEEHAAGGATHTDNGVLLCWWHHHTIDSSEWSIQMRGGVPFVASPGWLDRTRSHRKVANHRRGRPRGAPQTPQASQPSQTPQPPRRK